MPKNKEDKEGCWAPAKLTFAGDICCMDPINIARAIMAISGVDTAWLIPDAAFQGDEDLKAYKAVAGDVYQDVKSIKDIMELHPESWFGGFTEGTIGHYHQLDGRKLIHVTAMLHTDLKNNTDARDQYGNIKFNLGEVENVPSGADTSTMDVRFMQETEAGVDGMTAGYIFTNLAGIGFQDDMLLANSRQSWAVKKMVTEAMASRDVAAGRSTMAEATKHHRDAIGIWRGKIRGTDGFHYKVNVTSLSSLESVRELLSSTLSGSDTNPVHFSCETDQGTVKARAAFIATAMGDQGRPPLEAVRLSQTIQNNKSQHSKHPWAVQEPGATGLNKSIEDKLEEANRTIIIRGVESSEADHMAKLEEAVEEHLTQIRKKLQQTDMQVDEGKPGDNEEPNEEEAPPAAAAAPAEAPMVISIQKLTQRNKTQIYRCILRTTAAAQQIADLNYSGGTGKGPLQQLYGQMTGEIYVEKDYKDQNKWKQELKHSKKPPPQPANPAGAPPPPPPQGAWGAGAPKNTTPGWGYSRPGPTSYPSPNDRMQTPSDGMRHFERSTGRYNSMPLPGFATMNDMGVSPATPVSGTATGPPQTIADLERMMKRMVDSRVTELAAETLSKVQQQGNKIENMEKKVGEHIQKVDEQQKQLNSTQTQILQLLADNKKNQDRKEQKELEKEQEREREKQQEDAEKQERLEQIAKEKVEKLEQQAEDKREREAEREEWMKQTMTVLKNMATTINTGLPVTPTQALQQAERSAMTHSGSEDGGERAMDTVVMPPPTIEMEPSTEEKDQEGSTPTKRDAGGSPEQSKPQKKKGKGRRS